MNEQTPPGLTASYDQALAQLNELVDEFGALVEAGNTLIEAMSYFAGRLYNSPTMNRASLTGAVTVAVEQLRTHRQRGAS